ncbi:F-box domain, Skp2-like protein [Cordyceps fumosorosea ARSEF 2679]|uniref:F-box domain, Skp2-like protein n=1 Tax=Cordyceps fumosorosea (strain ARSEF 2679) TaxID=1081104 RepID=A0A167V6B6_CORFA|nr:F-box domain, Skp2-like protein [Cordyceps fumosorosea ARSEF 2679]OAA62273.1 F-box domain, Skp2-like protein [Cordyceps fumosorosea ARSEF 2679]
MSTGEGLDSELESFRKQWLSDLQSQREPTTADAAAPSSSPAGHHRRQSHSRRHDASHQSFSSSSARPGPLKKANGPPSPTAARRALILEEGSDYLGGRSFDEPAPSLSAFSGARTLAAPKPPERRLVSALDHYEEAMEKEAQERRYREKHFPAASANAPTVQASGSSSTVASTSATTTSAPAPEVPAGPPKTLSELLEGFAALQIEPATADDPAVEGEAPPVLPCPMASLPDELLTHILHDVAVADVAEYVRLSLVCRRLAYLVAREQRIWRRVCLGAEFGFAGMHYRWNRGIEWGPLSEESEDEQAAEEEDSDEEDSPNSDAIVADTDAIRLSPRERAERRAARLHAATLSLTPSVYTTWRAMFRARPRIRFGGCYISTVNYVRSGQASTNQLTWGGAPIHIVTYYRYLRFFRDGSLISLLASDPPADVVHYMTRDALRLHRESSSSSTAAGHHGSHLPGAVMRLAHRGRWRLSPPGSSSSSGGGGCGGGGAGAPSPSGDDELSVETEGVGAKYVFKMDLRVRSAGKPSAPRGNKLVLCGFYSYNKLTEDWAEFLLKNNKPFFFSRVRSYGLGE